MNNNIVTIEFKNVGRAKRCWVVESETDNPNILTNLITQEIESKAGLLSSYPDWYIDMETCKGYITTGFHKVGELEIHFDKHISLNLVKATSIGTNR